MVKIIDKVKEKVSDIKDTVSDKTNETLGLSSSENDHLERKYLQGGPDVEIVKVDIPTPDEYGSRENAIKPELKQADYSPATATSSPATATSSPATATSSPATATAIKTSQGFDQNYPQINNEFSNLFVSAINFWQNYTITWINYYAKNLNNYLKAVSDAAKESMDRYNNLSNSFGSKGYKINVE